MQWVRMFEFQLPENLSIFFDNLCIYYVCFDVISFLTIMFTWWFCKATNTVNQSADSNDREFEDDLQSLTNSCDIQQVEDYSKDDENYDLLDWREDNIVSNIKIMRQKALVKELQSKLSEDELEEEKKMEKMQLEKIFQLLQDQEDKFQMTSMEQLQDQLHLYRI